MPASLCCKRSLGFPIIESHKTDPVCTYIVSRPGHAKVLVPGSTDDETILEAPVFIEEHLEEHISIEELSAKYGGGRRNFDRRFTKATGPTLLDSLQRVKIVSARKSMETTRKTVSAVMYAVGYNDTNAFREVFRRVAGLSPIAYQMKDGR